MIMLIRHKKLSLIFLLVIFSAVLFAADGMPGLSFDMSRDEALSRLRELGFKRDMGEIGFYFVQAGSTIRLYFSSQNDELVSWLVTISMEGEDIDLFEEEIVEMLAQLHGYELDYDADYRETWWKLDLYHFVNAGFDKDLKNYIVFYGDIRQEEIIPY